MIERGYSVRISVATIRWYLHGKHHRGKDLPAVEWVEGSKEWWIADEPHRDNDLPAVDNITGYQSWFRYGKRHRDPGPGGDLPAIVWTDGKYITEME